ncbi:MAG: DNA polymerase III subunit gamma/tau [Deltaproteobacteria bacterium]|jgi:DNA polymerase-3 subunit gamma/tau|nr:DNA polymerase III subunit gamma/tau [Deltaproteobacteria bacterium]
MSYLVLARKYRPQTFEDLTGQEQVRQTLIKALKTGRVAHAYLFTGPRGVGKTTAARLLAMALSCKSEVSKPCGVCQNCQEIQNGECVDLMEVDGASNRGINEIRGLRDTVKYLPAKNPYKVYIIDEVHALTNDAFNALLKTLEEPPDHVIFIFATTEAHKVPATILSRCQRYDFKRIRAEDITNRLLKVAEIEKIVAEPEALTIIARQAEGGLRDALGMMDQVIASAGEITTAAVDQALGLINQNIISETAKAAFRGDTGAALDLMEKAYNLGSDFRELAIRVLEWVRGLTLYKANARAAEILDLTEKELAEYQELAKEMSLSLLHRHFEAWLRFQGELSRHPQPRWLMEAHLIKLCQTAPLTDLATLSARLTALLESSPELVKKNLELLALEAKTTPTAPIPVVATKAIAAPAPSTKPVAAPVAPPPPTVPSAVDIKPAVKERQEEQVAARLEEQVEERTRPKPGLDSEPGTALAPREDEVKPTAETKLETEPLAPTNLAPAAAPPVLPSPSQVKAPISPSLADDNDGEDEYADYRPPVAAPIKPQLSEDQIKAHVNSLKNDPIFLAFNAVIGGSIITFNQRANPISPMLIPEPVEEPDEGSEFDDNPAKEAQVTEETD